MLKGLFDGTCPVCGGNDFLLGSVLWHELIASWQLSPIEIDYVNRQQGFHCTRCHNNLRSMALAAALLSELSHSGTLDTFCTGIQNLKLLEINRAGNLTSYLQKLNGHILVEYPQYDILDLDFNSHSFDIVIHSDTLEHTQNPVKGLSECFRILRSGGCCIFTIPIIVDRLTRSRIGLPPSYHGQPDLNASDQMVFTEFGMDAWKFVLNAGFTSCSIFAFEYPSALALIAK